MNACTNTFSLRLISGSDQNFMGRTMFLLMYAKIAALYQLPGSLLVCSSHQLEDGAYVWRCCGNSSCVRNAVGLRIIAKARHVAAAPFGQVTALVQSFQFVFAPHGLVWALKTGRAAETCRKCCSECIPPTKT